MPNITLSEARVKALRTRRAAYDIRDPKLKGFGVRVLPSGAKRLFIHSQHRGQRTWKTVGDANTMALDEARTRADSILAAIRIGDDAPMATHAPCFETVAEAVFQRHAHIWKAKTLYSESLLLPMPAPSLVRRAVNCRHRSPGRATLVRLASGYARCRRPLQPILSVILREAELMGLPARGLQPLSGDTALPPQGARTVSHRRGNPPPRGTAGRRMRANGRFRWPQCACSCSRGAAGARCWRFDGPQPDLGEDAGPASASDACGERRRSALGGTVLRV